MAAESHLLLLLGIAVAAERGVACPPITIVECDPPQEDPQKTECYAPMIEYQPKEKWWTAKIKCEPRGRPVQLRVIVEGTTFIQAVSNNIVHPLEMILACTKNGKYVTSKGHPLDYVYCFAPLENV
ncbi:hypothetical protein NECAME_00002 [Necator americanus]|uniref:C6 domain-containing protein n=1 Tax=Necator americanus TaxID=51031 RepID=W2TZN4_NECAM|nr:hypothetical protein NECAME_00002 [Necator americanus]ETN87144.1 hypothetical protein NECAME_00002 [Necator americanus]